ncbi:sensor histidine kinase [Archangium sp.]|uniref:sensor histidine kinase n=1 Tax=Archangium sp. TaxID=1872627 RepID=UPI002D50CE18|nr:ATP-binding protein [Archangium sp.]HYO55411.1 ATP-binding protein [Archangium sp.]
MSGQEETGGASPEQKVAWLFKNTGHEVSQVVGLEPGTVDHFATVRAGLVHPRTYWKVWGTCPTNLDEALQPLEQERQARQADRALGVIMRGGLPADYKTNLEGRPTNAITLRRLALELSGIADEVRNFTRQYEESGKHKLYVSRRGRTQDGSLVDPVQEIESWVRAGTQRPLIITGPEGVGKDTVIRHAIYRMGVAFREDIETTTPLIWMRYRNPVGTESLHQGWAVSVRRESSPVDMPLPPRELIISNKTGDLPEEMRNAIRIELLPLELLEVESWFREGLPLEDAEQFSAAHGRVAAFRKLVAIPAGLTLLRGAVHSQTGRAHGPLPEWVARVVASYANRAVRSFDHDTLSTLEHAALRQFALNQGLSWDEKLSYEDNKTLRYLNWLTTKQARNRYGLGAEEQHFGNTLIRDYFVARRIASEVRAGRPEILTRYQFPQEYVLLFLAIIAPEVAARATADRSAELRATVENEVERRLQLTLSHMLKRSAGAIRSHLKTLKKRISSEEADALQYELTRIEQELTFQSELAEQTRLLHEVPEMVTEALAIEELIEPIIRQQKEGHPSVQCDLQLPSGLRVRASRNGLREVLSCLLENAFQATAYAEELSAPRVTVKAERVGDTVRIDILDNGPGIAAKDRERIFEPYVTTKKGGEGKPMGTGMGLAIARRYAQHMGGRVGLDPDRPETCFYVQLVAWKD